MAAGFVAGGLIQGIKFIEPKFLDDPVQGTKTLLIMLGKELKDLQVRFLKELVE